MAGALARILAMAVPLLAVSAEPLVTDTALGDEADVMLRSLGQLRGIPARAAPPRRLLGQTELRAELNAIVDKHESAAERETTRLIGTRLGLLPDGSDHTQLLADAIGAKPASFYDPLSRRLYVPNWIDLPNQRVSLAHELAHALADQRFGLRRVLGLDATAAGVRAVDTNGDRRRARQALIEGDAATLTLELFDPRGTLLSARELGALVQRLRVAAAAAPPSVAPPDGGPPPPPPPALIRQLLAFPAVEGLAFVGRIRNRQPWAAVDAIWARPPDSTEQILHPEKYDRGEAPLVIETAPLPSLQPGHRLAGTDTLGELTIRLWLGRSTSPQIAERAAEGWAGDRVAAYVPESPPSKTPPAEAVLAWLTIWDSPADAEDFATTAADILATMAGRDVSPTEDPSPTVFRDADGKLFALSRRADRVALLLGAPATALPALDQMLTQWRTPTPPPTKLKPTAPAVKPSPRPRLRR